MLRNADFEDSMALTALSDGLDVIRFAMRQAPGAPSAEPLNPELRARIFDLAETLTGFAHLLSGRVACDESEVKLLVTQTPRFKELE